MTSDESEILTPEIMPADSDSESSGSVPEFRVTLLARLKHTDLLEASRRLGSQAALAKHLEVDPVTLGNWINLKAFPSRFKNPERHKTIERKLFDLTGKMLDELFPERVRHLLGGLKLEVTRGLSSKQLERLAASSRAAPLQLEQPAYIDAVTYNELKDRLLSVLKTLPERSQAVLKLRYGLDGDRSHTLDEIGEILGCTKENVRVAEMRAIRKLQMPYRKEQLESLADEVFGKGE